MATSKKKTNTDTKTLELIQEVKKRKQEIAAVMGSAAFKTNCSFTYQEGNMSNAINLHVTTDVRALVMIVAFLRERQAAYYSAGNDLGVEDLPEFTWNGYSFVDWFDDIRLRLNKIQIQAKKKKLEALESRLEKIVSPELRAEMELESIMGELG